MVTVRINVPSGMMNLNFRKTGIGRAENEDGAVVEGPGAELMRYTRGHFQLKFEVNFLRKSVVVYIASSLHTERPSGMEAEEFDAEIRAGVAAAVGRKVILET